MRIGTKKFCIWIDLFKGKTFWHTGDYTVMISKGYYVDSIDDWGMNWWKLIPIGRRIKNWEVVNKE